MPWRALENLDYCVGQVEEKVEPDEQLDEDERCSLEGWCKHADV